MDNKEVECSMKTFFKITTILFFTLSLAINALFLVSTTSLALISGMLDNIGFTTPYSQVAAENKSLKDKNKKLKKNYNQIRKQVAIHANNRKNKIVGRSIRKASNGTIKTLATFMPVVANSVLAASVAYEVIELKEYCDDIVSISRLVSDIDNLDSDGLDINKHSHLDSDFEQRAIDICAQEIKKVSTETASNYFDTVSLWQEALSESINNELNNFNKDTADELGDVVESYILVSKELQDSASEMMNLIENALEDSFQQLCGFLGVCSKSEETQDAMP